MKKTMTETLEVSTRTGTLTKYAYGLISAFALFGFSNFWNSLGAFHDEVAARVQPQVVVKQTTTAAQLTAKLFQRDYIAEDFEVVATERKMALLALAESDPAAAQAAIVAGPVLEKLPTAARALLEQEVTVAGTLEVMHYDTDMDNNVNRQSLFLVQGDQRVRVYTPNVSDFEPLANAQVKLRAWKLDNANLVIAAADAGTTAVTETSIVAAAPVTTRTVAVILFNFQNDTRQNITPAQAKSVIFGSSNSVNAYDQEVSFGQLGLTGKVDPTGDVYGFFTIPYNSAYNLPLDSTTDCSTNYRTWSAAARNAVTAAGNDLSGYNHFVYLFSAPYCPGAGWAELNSDESWATNFSTRILTHEHGHNLAAMHASTYACTDAAGARTTISNTCTIGEYGDPFDVMGNVLYHFNNAHKNETKFLPAANIQDVTLDGEYRIYPIEQGMANIQAIRIPRNLNAAGAVSQHYWLEYRRPFGLDNFSTSNPVVNGVTVRLARNGSVSGYLSPNTLLLDSTPATSSFADAPLLVGQTFDDTYFGYRFQTLETTAEYATVRVSRITASCVRGTPTVSIVNPSSIYASSGQTLPYNLSTTNTDSPACAPAAFTVTPSLPTGWSQTPSPITFTLNPGQTNYTTLNVSSLTTEVAGTYDFSELVTNTASNLSRSIGSSYIVTGPDVTAPVVTISSPVNNAKLKGKNYKIQSSASDPSGIATIQIAVDGVLKQTCTNTTACNYMGLLSTLTSGAHTIMVQAIDKSVNANAGLKTITVTK